MAHFDVPFLTIRFFAPIREFGENIQNDKSHFYWLARFNRKMLFHFLLVLPLISYRSVWHNGKHPSFIDACFENKLSLGANFRRLRLGRYRIPAGSNKCLGNSTFAKACLGNYFPSFSEFHTHLTKTIMRSSLKNCKVKKKQQ